MPILTTSALVVALLSWAPLAAAQNTLGELLDAGATRLSAEDFRKEVVGHLIVGSTATGANLELVYIANGIIIGTGAIRRQLIALAQVSGSWTIDSDERVCTAMRIDSAASFPSMFLPSRCQMWFKAGDRYFLSDSDSDRGARVFSRTLKQ